MRCEFCGVGGFIPALALNQVNSKETKLMKKILLCVSIMAVLAACGGSGSVSVSGDGGDEPNAFAFDDPNVARTGFTAIQVAASFDSRTTFVDVRPLGSATYQGYAFVALIDGFEEQSMLGTFELEADFVGSEISGSATDFVGFGPTGVGGELASTGDVSGTLSITSGTIFDNAGSAIIAADIDGTLQDGGTRIDIDTTLVGGFVGAGADYVVASTGSTAVAEVTTISSGVSTEDLSIDLAGERQ